MRPAVAVIAAAVMLAGCGGSERPAARVKVDGSAGRIGPISLGEPLAGVLDALGPPSEVTRGGGFAPAGKLPSDVDANGGSFSVPESGAPPQLLRYEHTAVILVEDRVFALLTDESAARTERGVGIDDPLSAVKTAYREAATCIPESTSGEFESPAHCAVTVPAGRLGFGGDPIKSIQLIGGRRYTGGAPHTVYLRQGDSAEWGNVRCTARTLFRLVCRRKPQGDFGYYVVLLGESIQIYKRSRPDSPVYVVPQK